MTLRIAKVVSGGQTGVDRAGLDAARDCGIPIGGWCPRGRRAEDGRIPKRYPLEETESADYLSRTYKNIETSDATLVFTPSAPQGGSLRTIEHAQLARRPLFRARWEVYAELGDLGAGWLSENILEFFEDHVAPRAVVVNVAGSRASTWPEGRKLVRDVLVHAFKRINR